MILGIGTDILNQNRLCDAFLQPGDPFFHATYSHEEQEAAESRADRKQFLAGRFAAKEAICKCLGLGQAQKRVLLREISVLSDEDGAPYVRLTGEMQRIAAERNISGILVSLSFDGDLVVSFALAQSN